MSTIKASRENRKSLAAACSKCGGWTNHGGMSHEFDTPEGCKCMAPPLAESSSLELTPFDQEDWHGYAACESACPNICYLSAEIVMIVDGDVLTVEFTDVEGNEPQRTAERKFTCDTAAIETAESLLLAYRSLPHATWFKLVYAAVGKLA